VVVVHLEGYAAARLALRYSHGARCVLVLHGRGTGGLDEHSAADLSIVLNDAARAALENDGVPDHRLRSMVPSIDRALFRPDGRPEVSAPTLGYVGRLEGTKGAFDLPAVVRGLADLDARLECVGSALDTAASESTAFAGLPIELTGELPAGEVAARMRGWSVLVLPSYTEGMPLVALEALCSGVPVVAVEGVLPQTLATKRGVWVGPREGLTDRVRAALNSDRTVDADWIPGHEQGGAAWDDVFDALPAWRPRPRPSARPLAGRLGRLLLRR
jgi:glycosyltransferase involved in cell wall biosynthesis